MLNKLFTLMAKTAPYFPRTVTLFCLKYQDPARMLRKVTLTNYNRRAVIGKPIPASYSVLILVSKALNLKIMDEKTFLEKARLYIDLANNMHEQYHQI